MNVLRVATEQFSSQNFLALQIKTLKLVLELLFEFFGLKVTTYTIANDHMLDRLEAYLIYSNTVVILIVM